MRQLLEHLLQADGYDVRGVSNSADALRAVAAEEADLVLLDVTLGTEDGRELLGELRYLSDVPIVFLTGRGLEVDRIAGLKMGADDYIVKPFSPGELTARVESVLRRSHAPHQELRRDSAVLQFGELRIDPVTRDVELGDQLLDLTAKEFDVLAFLAASPRQVFSRQQLLQQVWESSSEWQDEATVTEHVRRVRRKIEVDANHPQWITTVRGIGYRFEPNLAARTKRFGSVPELV